MHEHWILESLRLEIEEMEHTSLEGRWFPGGARHIDSMHRIYLMLDEGAWIEFRGRRRELHPGRLYLLPADTEFRYGVRGQAEQYYVHFHARVLGSLNPFDLFNWHSSASPPEGIPHRELFFLPSTTEDRNSHSAWLSADAGLRRMLACLIEDRLGPDQKRHVASLSRFQPVFHHIDQNLSENFRLSRLAALAHLQPNYFSNAFKMATGLPPGQYINRRRIQRAEQMLRDSDLPLHQIALQLGFCDAFHFSKVFKKFRGVSPSEFRGMPQLP